MIVRIRKEIRPMILPWIIGALAALSLPQADEAGLGDALKVVYYACVGLVAAAAFGAEFHHRTLPLLLSQPIERSTLWEQKHLVMTLAVGALGSLGPAIQGLVSRLEWGDWISLGSLMFLAPAVCWLGLWVRATRSLFLSACLAAASQFLLLYLLVRGLGVWKGVDTLAFVPRETWLALTLMYSAMLVWLGRGFWKGLLRASLRKDARHLGLAVFVGGVFLLGLGQWVRARQPEGRTSGEDSLLEVLILVATIGSTGLWTLVARSTIGGLVFGALGQFLWGLLAYLAGHLLLSLPHFPATTAWVVLAVAYARLCYCLGRRLFVRLQLRDSTPEAGLTIPGLPGSWRLRLGWLRCRSRGALGNLARKELRLQKPVLLVAVVLTVCWLAALGLAAAWRSQDFSALFLVLGCCYVPTSLLLSSSISLGEERSLGFAGWQLTLPIPVWRQWAIRLGVGAASGAALGLGLPMLLMSLARLIISAAGWEEIQEAWRSMMSFGFILFFLGFWTATFTGNPVKAGLAALVGLAAAGAFAYLGANLGSQSDGLLSAAATSLLGPAAGEITFRTLAAVAYPLALGAVLAVLLWQSLALYRRPQAPWTTWVKSAALIAVVIFLASFCYADLVAALHHRFWLSASL